MLWCERVEVCVEEKTQLAGEKRGIINFSSSAVEMANEFCSHPVRAGFACGCLSPSTLINHCPPGSPDVSSGLAETSSPASLLRLTTTTIPPEVARASRGLPPAITLPDGVFISPVRPTEGNRLVQCALTTTNRRLPASMASNTHRRLSRKRARQSGPSDTVLPGQEPVLPQCPSRPISLLQRRPSSR